MRVGRAFVGGVLAAGLFAVSCVGCDNGSSGASAASAGSGAGATASSPAAPPPEPQAPEIIVDPKNIDVGKNRVAVGEPGLADRVLVFLKGAPKIQGAAVDVVAMRAAKPSDVAAVLDALQQAGAASGRVKTESREGPTKALPVSLVRSVPDCTPVAWIGKAATLDVWPASGGVAKRTGRGLAGPDLTLGMDSVHKLTEACEAPVLVVGADDTMTWGLVFDLGMEALHQPWTRASTVAVVAQAVPGRKLAWGAGAARP